MGEEIPHGQSQTETVDLSSEAGWVTMEVAARAVRVSPRTILRYIDQGQLQAEQQGEGVGREWLVSVDSLHALLALRTVEEQRPRNAYTDTANESAHSTTDSIAGVIREMSVRLERRAQEAAELRVRLKLTERSQSTLEEERRRSVRELEDERRWRAEAEQEDAGLRQELEALEAEFKNLEAPGSPTSPALDSEGQTPGLSGEASMRPQRGLSEKMRHPAGAAGGGSSSGSVSRAQLAQKE